MELYVPGGGFEFSACLGSAGEVLIVALRVTRHNIHSHALRFAQPQITPKSRMNIKTHGDLAK